MTPKAEERERRSRLLKSVWLACIRTVVQFRTIGCRLREKGKSRAEGGTALGVLVLTFPLVPAPNPRTRHPLHHHLKDEAQEQGKGDEPGLTLHVREKLAYFFGVLKPHEGEPERQHDHNTQHDLQTSPEARERRPYRSPEPVKMAQLPFGLEERSYKDTQEEKRERCKG